MKILQKLFLIITLFTTQITFAQQENLDSLLFEAVKANKFEQVKQLINRGALINEEMNLLFLDKKAILFLLKKGLDINYSVPATSEYNKKYIWLKKC